MEELYLLLGSNLGNSKEVLSQCLFDLERFLGPPVRVSGIYQSLAWGFSSSSPFLNQAIVFKTNSNPEQILAGILVIENKLGRIRKTDSYEDRVIDIDIIFYGKHRMNQTDLVIPHPRFHLRNFALFPLFEIAPEFCDPQSGKTIRQLKEESPDQDIPKVIL